jgi:hypothetical protein
MGTSFPNSTQTCIPSSIRRIRVLPGSYGRQEVACTTTPGLLYCCPFEWSKYNTRPQKTYANNLQSQYTKEVESCDSQWQAALECFLMEVSIVTLQCLLLAQICCLQKADFQHLMKYKGLAVSLSQRLGLHQSQKRFALGALTCETRKKLFWTMYTLDWYGKRSLFCSIMLIKFSFSAAQLGLPRLMRDDDAQCEYPVDADDEYVTEKGFLPTLPGEYTKLSSALALFKASRILAKVLSEVYPSSAAYEISFRKLETLSDELEEWSSSLPSHLRLQFVQDKPSTSVISSRSPLLVRNHESHLKYNPVHLYTNSLDSPWDTIISVR